MKYSVQLEGFEGRTIEVEPPGFLSKSYIYLDGIPIAPIKKGQYLLKRSDGTTALAKVKQSLFYDAPSLNVDGKTIPIVEPLAWYQYVLSMGPIAFLLWGLVGALVAIGLISANVRIFRSKLSQPLKYLSVCAISFVLPVVSLLFSYVVYQIGNLR